MKSFTRIVSLALLMLCASASFAGPTDEDRMKILRSQMESTVTYFEKAQTQPEFRVEPRNLTQYAHYVLVLGQDPAKADAALMKAFAIQDKNPSSPKFGEFPVMEGAAESGNATEYTVFALLPIRAKYADKLKPETLKAIDACLKAAIGPLSKRTLPVDSTSVYLMNAVSRALIGEFIDDKRAMAEGRAVMESYITLVQQRGVAEYNGPNATAVQLTSLLFAHNCTSEVDTRRSVEPVLRLVWAQVTASTLIRRGVMAGPESRNFDFLSASGALDSYLYAEGLRDQPPLTSPFSEGLRAYSNIVEGGWRPPAVIKDLARIPERVVRQRWDLEPGCDRYVYITDDMAIGSSSRFFSAHDRKLTVDFNTTKTLQTISVVADPYDSPYGRIKFKDRPGFARPQHLHDNIASVQEKGTLLALMEFGDELKGRGSPGLGTNVLIPTTAGVVVMDGKQANFSKPFEMPGTVASVVGIREGKGAVAIRLFQIDGVAGQAPRIMLKNDGNAFGVARFVGYHFKGDGRTPIPDAPIRAGVLMIAGHVENDQEFDALMKRAATAKIDQKRESARWSVTLVDGSTTLEAALDVNSGKILARKVNGEDFYSPVFHLNERDLAGELVERWQETR